MLCRKAKIEIINCPGKYYLEINDVFDNLFKQYDDKDRLNDVQGEIGTKISEVLRYIQDYGLPGTSAPRNPRIRNIHSFFCTKVPRQKIISYGRLLQGEAFGVAKVYPIIANARVHSSFNEYFDEIIYEGPGITDKKQGYHAMVVVGNVTLKRDNEEREYFIVQNCWGKSFGHKGLVLIPMDKKILVDFWMPTVTPLARDSLLRIESAREERAKKRKLDQRTSTSEFQLEEENAKSKKTIVETTSKDSIAEIMSRSKNIDAQSWDVQLLILQHNYKLDVHALNSHQPGEFECREFRESILGVMPHHWDGCEDTLLKLTHFRRYKRKTLKKSPGKISIYPFHKPEEKHPPGKDVTKKVSNEIEKAVTIAKSAKTKKKEFPQNAHHREIAVSISNYTLKHGDSGLVIVGGRMEMQPHMHVDPFEEGELAEKNAEQHRRSAAEKDASENAGNVDLRHFAIYAFAGRSGELRWSTKLEASENAGNVDLQHFAIYAFAGRSGELRWSAKLEDIDDQSSDASQLIPQHNYKLDVHALNSRQPGEDGREDTLLKLTHFRRHKRKTLKKSPGKISNYPFHKMEEKHPPGTDVTKKVSNVIEKAVTIAKSAKTKKPSQSIPTIRNYTQLSLVPNVIVTHEKEGSEAIHLASGRTICKDIILSRIART